MTVERKPGGKKAWCVLKKMEKSLVFLFSLNMNDKVELKHLFIPIILFKQEIQSNTSCMLYLPNFYAHTCLGLGLEHRLKPFIIVKGIEKPFNTYCGLQHKDIRLKPVAGYSCNL